MIDLQKLVRLDLISPSVAKTEMSDLVYFMERFMLTSTETVTSYIHLVRLHDLAQGTEPDCRRCRPYIVSSHMYMLDPLY